GSNSIEGPDSLVFNAAGDLWVANVYSGLASGGSVVEYTPAQLATTGDPTPAVTLFSVGSNSIEGPDSLVFNATGDLWVANMYGGPAGGGSVVEYTPAQLAATGYPTPADTIAGAATGLSTPEGLAIEQAPTVSAVSPATGPGAGGTEVTISGTGFDPGSTVDFGATPEASVSYVSPYRLIAVSPAGSGTVDVTATTGEGTSASSSADRFSYATTTTTPSTTTPTKTTTTPTTTQPPVLRPRLRSGGHELKATGAFAGVPLGCSVAGCHGTLTLSERVTVRVRHAEKTVRRQKTVVLATERYSLGAGRHATLRVRLNAAARAALTKAERHRVSAQATVTVTGGTTLKENVTLIEQVNRRKPKQK
ncbi:MAG: IPT/TIG domain-containing protein, partial [Solirubrobacteraceae bacterium]